MRHGEVPGTLAPLDARITRWMAKHGVTLTRIALGIVFLWFGALKLIPGASPAEDLATRTITRLTGGRITAGLALYLLPPWEVLIGPGPLRGGGRRVPLV